MNSYSMGIEVVWPNSSWAFSNRQYRKVIDLVKYLMVTFWIPKENVIKHSDITWSWSKNKRLWDGKSPARKTDLSPRFWHDRWYTTYTIWRDSVLK